MFAGSARSGHMNYLAARREVGVFTAPRLMRRRNPYIKISAYRHFKARYKRSATPT
jgi:hypothetical protein